MSYAVQVSRRADKMLARLDRTTAQRIQKRIDRLTMNPQNPRLSREVEMAKGQWCTRVGDWRIIYKVNEKESLIFIVTIQHRSKVYKDLSK